MVASWTLLGLDLGLYLVIILVGVRVFWGLEWYRFFVVRNIQPHRLLEGHLWNQFGLFQGLQDCLLLAYRGLLRVMNRIGI